MPYFLSLGSQILLNELSDQNMAISNWNVLNPITANTFVNNCSLIIFGGFGVFGSTTVITRILTNLPSHWKIFLKFTFIKIDDWGAAYLNSNLKVMIDSAAKLEPFTAQDNLYIQSLCGNKNKNS